MFAVLRFLGRLIAGKRIQKSRWFRRIAILVAVGQWLSRRMTRSENIYLARGETLDVVVTKKEGNRT